MKTKTALLFLCIATSVFAQLPKGNRMVAYQLDMTENNNYDSAFSYGYKACMESGHTPIFWSDMEPIPNQIGGALFNSLDGFNSFYASHGMKVELQITVTNGAEKTVPSDLMPVSFSSPVMISRFKIFMDSILNKIPNIDLSVLNIGNESDALFGTNTAAYADFKTFLDSVTPFVKQKYFNIHGTILKIGTTFTWSGLTYSPTKNLCKSVNLGRDVVAVTYYPQLPGFHMEDPGVVPADFGQLIAEYPDTLQPIYFVECGYPSSTSCGGSLTLQSLFVKKVFEAWDTYYSNIKYISFYKTTDWRQGIVDTVAIHLGMPNDTVFKGFMISLGLRTYPGNGTNKPAYDTLLCQLGMRGFCATVCTSTGIVENVANNNTIIIYPNPASDKLFIETNRTPPITEINIYTITGSLIIETKQQLSKSIDISQLAPGTYITEIKMKDISVRKRWVKM